MSEEKYCINEKTYININIKKDIEKRMKHIEIDIKNEPNGIFVYGSYQKARSKIWLCLDCLYRDYDGYIKFTADNLAIQIAKIYFLGEKRYAL